MTAISDSIILETERLIVRPFTLDDLETIHQLLVEAFGDHPLGARREWLEWQVMDYAALARLFQPPYGDRALALKATNTLIGSVGLVPCYGPFDTLPYFRQRSAEPPSGLNTPEMGLFWALGKQYRGQGYATEGVQALIEYAFTRLNLKHIVATTEYHNVNSIAVMERLGMTVERNPHLEPVWFQIVGILANPRIGQ